MGLFRKKTQDAEHLRTMQEQMRSLAERLERSDAAKTELEARVARLDTEVEQRALAITEPPVEPPPAPEPSPPAVAEARVIEIEQRLADLALVATDAAERASAEPSEPKGLGELRARLDLLAETVATLDGRVGQVGTELTNQLGELSGELDDLHRRADKAADVDHRLVDITDGQVRLANEQARYEIQFREDLAELAEKLRRPGAR